MKDHAPRATICRAPFAVFALFCVAAASNAQDRQDLHDGSEPFGRVVSPFTVDELIRRPPTQTPQAAARSQKEEKPAYGLLASPVIVDRKGAFISGLTAGVTRSGRYPVQVKASYKQISMDGGGDDRDKLGASVKLGLLATRSIKLGVNGDYGRVRRRSGRFDGVLAAEAPLGKGVAVTANVGVTTFRPRDGSRQSGLLAGAGLSYERNAVTVGVDYSFKNDVDEEDDYSLSFTHLLSPISSSLTVGVGKHGLVRVAYLVRF
jgi:hypothetical protein